MYHALISNKMIYKILPIFSIVFQNILQNECEKHSNLT